VGAGEIAAEPRDLCEIDGERLDPWRIGAIAHDSVEHVDFGWVSATSAGPWGAARAIIAVQKQRQAMTEKTATSLVRRSTVRRRAASARQPDFSTLWNSSIFQRHAY